MSSGADLQPCYKVANAPLNVFPYPHFFLEEVFDPKYYDRLQAMLPEPADMLPIAQVRPVKGYDERFVFDLTGPQLDALPAQKQVFWRELHQWLVGGRFGQVVLNRFGHFMNQRFTTDQVALHDEALLVQDVTDYKLGPHTDAPRKVVTLIFYLPKDTSQSHMGTSIYVPKDAAFRCPGGPHYPHDAFDRVWTAPFLPNSLFAFFKTDNSFHGVERVVDEDCRRWLLLYDFYEQAPRAAASAPAPAAAKVKFSF